MEFLLFKKDIGFLNNNRDVLFLHLVFIVRILGSFFQGSSLAVISAQVTIFADPMGVVCSIDVRALVGKFFASSRVIAVSAHSLSIK